MTSSAPVLGPRASGLPSQRGVTLLELMVTLAVLAILVAIAVPSMTSLINSNRLAGATSELAAAFQLARTEAIRRNSRVSVCPTTDFLNCASSEDWQRLIVLGTDNTTGNNVVIRDVALPAGLQMAGPEEGVTFRPSGLIDQEAQLAVCAPKAPVGENQRVMTVMISGNVNTIKSSGGEGCAG